MWHVATDAGGASSARQGQGVVDVTARICRQLPRWLMVPKQPPFGWPTDGRRNAPAFEINYSSFFVVFAVAVRALFFLLDVFDIP